MKTNGHVNGTNGNGHAKQHRRPVADPETEQQVMLALALGWKPGEVARIFRMSKSLVSVIQRRHLEQMERRA